ncbi:MAG: ATP-grasp domain-containing protein, partial [Hydrogenophaga sp.]|nr:ATP-grasp domain-containing protein [Hydrogenophaga sp.]
MPLTTVGLLFAYDWDWRAFGPMQGADLRWDHYGFDLFSFPSNLRLAGFDMRRTADRLAERGRRAGWRGVLSHHEQFGALTAALVAERLRLPGAPVESILAAQHKWHARRVLQ